MKRSQIKRRPLADSVLERLEPEDKEYREIDSPGLYFRVKTNGSKSWSLRYKRPNGKWAWRGLGPFPQVSGRKAREKARELLRMAHDGIDLATIDKANDKEESDAYTFAKLAEEWYARKAEEGLSDGTLRLMRDTITRDLKPALGPKSVRDITRMDCTETVSAIEHRGAWHIAKKARSWLNNMFSLAIAMGYCDFNPASELRHVARKPPKTKPHPHLTESELPDFLRALSTSGSHFPTRVATKMLLLTASRPGMVRKAEWSEIDFDNALWVVPAAKMKMNREHIVPLQTQLIHLLGLLREITGHCQYLFPGKKGNPFISQQTINSCFHAIGYKDRIVGHGARHTASTLLHEHGWRPDYVEMQLAHKIPGVRGVYNQAKYLEQRRIMMQWYADYLDALEAGITDEIREQFDRQVLS